MTKHFRKEHPTESVEQEEDADYSDVDPSDDEPSLEQDADDSPDSMKFGRENNIKTEAPSNAAPSNYSANLWRLPAQTAQWPDQHQTQISSDLRTEISAQTVKLERSLSRTPQRNLIDHGVSGQVTSTGYVQSRANTIPDGIQRGTATSFAAWQSHQMQESPTSVTSPHDYQVQSMNLPASAQPQYRHHVLPMSQAPLQPVNGIILEDPQQAQYTHPPQHIYTHSHYTQSRHDLRDEMPGTPAPNQQIPYAPSMESETPYQAPEFLPPEDYDTVITGAYALPQQAAISIYNDALDLHIKELKPEDAWAQMPEQVIRW